MHTKGDYASDMAAVTASFFPPVSAPRLCGHVRKDWAIKRWSKCCCSYMVQQLSSGASPVPYMSHLTIWHKASSGCYYTCHPLDNSWAESPLHRHDRSTPPADEGVICTEIRWKPLQSPRWNAICFAHAAWTPWRSDFPLGSDQARNKVRVWLHPCWKGQADPKFGCLIAHDFEIHFPTGCAKGGLNVSTHVTGRVLSQEQRQATLTPLKRFLHVGGYGRCSNRIPNHNQN